MTDVRGDPYPGRELLTPTEVRRLLGFSDARDFDEFVKTAERFPKSVTLGKTKQGRTRTRFKKAQVMAFIELLGS